MVQQSRHFRNTYSDSIYRITGKAPSPHTWYSSPLMNLQAYFSLGVTQALDWHHMCNGPASKYHTGVKEANSPGQPNPLYVVLSFLGKAYFYWICVRHKHYNLIDYSEIPSIFNCRHSTKTK